MTTDRNLVSTIWRVSIFSSFWPVLVPYIDDIVTVLLLLKDTMSNATCKNKTI